jgi:dolichyl-phosphate beta-glucosyltransferase
MFSSISCLFVNPVTRPPIIGEPPRLLGVTSPSMDAPLPVDVDLTVHTSPWVLSVIVPACNATSSLERTLKQLIDLPGGSPHEIVVVENGSDDGTWDLLDRLQASWGHPGTALVALRSERGIGSAYRAGVAASTGDRVLLTADDLPFGTSDVEAVLACRAMPRFAIGSKAHPRSRVPRGLARRVATGVFRVARRIVLGLDVGDTQGTFVIDGELARSLVASTTVSGFGMTTELVALAERHGEQLIELPVVLDDPLTPSRIRWFRDSLEMIVSLYQLRRRLGSNHRRRVIVLPSDAPA